LTGHINFTLASFKWASGLYIIVEKNSDTLSICKINEGVAELDPDGNFSISHTGINNSGIIRTKMIYLTDKEKRKLKLKKNENS